MSTAFDYLRRTWWAGASLGLALSLAGCTEEPAKPKPTPAPTTPAPNAAARPFADYTRPVAANSDDFGGGALDQQKWSFEVRDSWFNDEKQATTNSPNNLFLDDGKLHIVARREAYNGKPFTSARIVTKNKMNYGFGRLDVRAKLPKGQGIWPAIWMLGVDDATAGWPACGEIDIMELRGSQPDVNVTSVHYGPSATAHLVKTANWRLPTGDFSQDFHTFSLIRSENQIRWFVDGTEIYSVNSSQLAPYPFNNPFYAILNVAVGGDFGGDPSATEPFPKEMVVDYVHFFQYPE
ncbi:glycoside hydrolase family 16 protein [Hymenobacter sp. 15J16-1T3B]|uniref:glycoside hydrolase family 16 protein n=1 Tax=Hymenobacter sp. 15J16-1T3B TaxID=2886941 RepID=UPI001D114C08|nr:glycoside hydrolase family 16 protein [Hymenobacter sp. 15J16-1T3B]MCC3158554.1 glycoside hydrolase family 16 protein [Hymenobacter sp. 15J16-1T3B]